MSGLPALPGLTPDRRLAAREWMTAAPTRRVVAALTARGATVRFVGGCVRDSLAGRTVKDVDIATPDTPEQVSELLALAGVKVVPTGFAHGTVTAVADGRPYEITTLRRDVETDGRRAKVAFTDDWEADAARRDFTMNAISAEPDGTIHDPFGGLTDLVAGRVRFVGDAATRIREDVLRILRFFRFHASHGSGAPDPAGMAACRALAELLPGLSAERVQAEVLRLLEAPDPAPTVAIMIDADIFKPILPEIVDAPRLAALVAVERRLHVADRIRRLAALMPPGSDRGAVTAARLKLSNADKRRLELLTRPPLPVAAITLTRDMRSWRRALQSFGANDIRDLAIMAWADEALIGDVAEADAQAFADIIALADGWTPVPFPISGRDVRKLGVPTGPQVGELLDTVKRWWENEDYRPDRAQCLARLAEAVGGSR